MPTTDPLHCKAYQSTSAHELPHNLMLSRIFSSAKNFLKTTPTSNCSGDSQVHSNSKSIKSASMVSTRSSRGIDDVPTPRKRSPKEMSGDEGAVNMKEEDPEPTHSKRQKVGQRGKTPKKQIKLPMRATIPVVEIPVIAPIPPAHFSNSENIEEKESHDLLEKDSRDVEEKRVGVEVNEDTHEKHVDKIPESERPQSPHISKRKEPSVAQSSITLQQPRYYQQAAIPDLLPAELLQDDTPEELIIQEVRKEMKAKKTKFADMVKKTPKDRKIGSTTYKITKVQNSKLAPKSNTQARATKENWLNGRQDKKSRLSRKPFSKGFFLSKR